MILYHFVQFGRHASHLIFFDPGFNFFLNLSDFLRFFENVGKSRVGRIERNGTVLYN